MLSGIPQVAQIGPSLVAKNGTPFCLFTIAVLEQSINHCWTDVYALKDQSSQTFSRRPAPNAMDDLNELHRLFSEEG